MIEVKDAARKAVTHLVTLYPDQDLGTILFEEAELSDDEQFWLITISFRRLTKSAGVGESVFVGDRSYKVFKLVAATGEVRSIKNRKLK